VRGDRSLTNQAALSSMAPAAMHGLSPISEEKEESRHVIASAKERKGNLVGCVEHGWFGNKTD